MARAAAPHTDPLGNEASIRDSLLAATRVEAALKKRYPFLPDDSLHDAVIDAVIEWYRSDAGAAPMPFVKLFHASWCNAANAARSSRAHARRECEWQARTVESLAMPAVAMENSRVLVAEVERHLPDPRMKDVFRLWIAGERRSAAFAAQLDFNHLPISARHRAIKREKDRMLKWLARSQAVRNVCLEWLK